MPQIRGVDHPAFPFRSLPLPLCSLLACQSPVVNLPDNLARGRYRSGGERTCRLLTLRHRGVLAPEQKREPIEKLTDATASVYGEGIRQVTWVVIEDMGSSEWGIAGKPVTTTDIEGLLQAGQKVAAGS